MVLLNLQSKFCPSLRDFACFCHPCNKSLPPPLVFSGYRSMRPGPKSLGVNYLPLDQMLLAENAFFRTHKEIYTKKVDFVDKKRFAHNKIAPRNSRKGQ